MARMHGWIELPNNHVDASIAARLRRLPQILLAPLLVGAAALICIFWRSQAWVALMLLCASILSLFVGRRLRTRIRHSRTIGQGEARRCNKDREKAVAYVPERYANLVRDIRPTDQKDERRSDKLLAKVAQQLVSIGAYEETGGTRVSLCGKTEREVLIVETYAAISQGRGFVLLEPFGREIAVCSSIDQGIIYRALRDAGILEWEVDRISYEDDMLLFLLFNPREPISFDLTAPGEMYKHLRKLAANVDDCEIPLQPGLSWDMGTCPHAIIAGPSGSGKTYLLNYIFAIASIKGCYLLAADPKRSDLAAMSQFMPLERVAYEPDQILHLIDEAVEIMKRRYAIISEMRCTIPEFFKLYQADFRSFGFMPVLLCIDETAAFAASLDKQQRAQFESAVKAITLQGRQSGVGLVSIMQQPNATNINTESRSQAGLRVMLGNATKSEYKMLFDGDAGSSLPRRPGQGFCTVLGKTFSPVRFEAPRLDKAQIAETMRQALSNQAEMDPLACGRSRSEAESTSARP